MTKLQHVFALLLLVPGLALASDALDIGDPWSPEAPPGRMMAGFMTLQNNGETPIALVGGESPQFGHVEIHTMIMDDGVMRMRKLDELVIEPGETTELKPGGLHVMLMQPQQSFTVGDTIDITLIDADGNQYPLVSEVRSRTRPAMMD
ncbi:MAG: copper chaperone PCu(A)C [Wenzhouxiangella sp.]|nr:copper chaperone PCu(A)C [Wenzhouxiangella sp.]